MGYFGINFWVFSLLFGALMGYFWVWSRVRQLFRGLLMYLNNFHILCFFFQFEVYSCSWTTFIFFVSFNFDIWFWLNFGVIFYFLGPNGLFLALGKGSKKFWGSTHVVEQLLFCMLSAILAFDFDLIFGSFLTFWSPNWLSLVLG